MKFSEIEKKLRNENKINFDTNKFWTELNILKREYVPLGEKFGLKDQIISKENKVIENINNFNSIDRLQYEVNLYAILLGLYTNIDFEDKDITDKFCDLFIQYRFKEWLSKRTKNDSYEMESIFRNIVMDEVRRLNFVPQYDFDGMKLLIEEFKNIPIDTFKTIDKITTVQNPKGSD